ncbi:MAG: hypothetical protein HUU35_16230, partial [Armatimonadetes bacterium]|nr:hypothetical protein [Armatimonadota bacterium]
TGALAARDANGRWTFQPDARRAVLGAAGETNVGIMAPQVAAILRAGRAGADEALLAEGLKGLEQLRAHRIPRGAQVWEVPLHAPDILASAIACDAFTLGYTLTGDRRYLADADYWARTALPFIYHWQHPRPDLAPMRGGTIPVFGATFYTNSWFGRLVQWNGLALARALFQLQRAGGEARWARVAEDITVSAMRQQVADPQSPLVGLYPDFWNMRTGIPGYWMSPTPILARALEAVGETPEGDWRVIRNDGRLVTLAAPTPAANLRLNHEPMAACGEASGSFTLSFDLRYELGPAAYLGLSGVASPAAVRVDGTALPAGLGGGETAGWQHYPDQALLVLRLDHRQREQVAVVLEGLQAADPAAPPREWRFGSGPDGWDGDPHEVTAAWEQGRLILTATGDDPYLSGPPLALPATGIKQVVVRARVTSAGPLTIFFATDSGGYSEQQLLRTAPIPADGRWHEVSAKAANHPRWTGQLRRLRLNPPGSRGAVTEIAAIALR